jgi:hypothetical protein
MTLNPVARATARRNVADRIDRFLNGLQGARRLPNRRELFWLRDALVNLEQGQYPEGEDAVDKAERMLAIPDHAATDSRRDRLGKCAIPTPTSSPSTRVRMEREAEKLRTSNTRRSLGLSSIEPNDRSGEMDRGQEVSSGFVISSCDGAKLLELAVEVLDEMASLVELLVESSRRLAGASGWNDEGLRSQNQIVAA